MPFALKSANSLKLALKNPDFTTADRIASTINGQIAGAAEVLDPATVERIGTAEARNTRWGRAALWVGALSLLAIALTLVAG